MPLCRAYARHFVGDKPADTVLCTLAALSFSAHHKYWPRFMNPRTFEEKVCVRMLFDRNPLWTTFCDKWQVRQYVAEKGCAEYLVPILWHGRDAAEIPFDNLPPHFVLKATHGCGYNIIVKDNERLDHKSTRQILQRWLRGNFCTDVLLGTQWAYRNIPPLIIAEEFIGEGGNVPVDYKFFCFAGRVEYVLLSFDRYGNHSKLIVDKAFRPTGLQRGHQRYEGLIQPPPNCEAMIRVAETLAKGIDMIRVDLYNVEGRIYFGEMTCYPGGGKIPFEPRSEDFAWGAKWQMAPLVQPKAGDNPQSRP